VTWQANPPPDSVSGCELGIAYHYDGDIVTTVSCSATWPGPDTITRQYTIHVETSTPTAFGAPTRSPDSNGWYNHPVEVAFHGTSFSGIASCTTATYAGPDTPNATLNGNCRDNAGKTAAATSPPFQYDASPPALDVASDTGDGIVVLRWAAADVDLLASVKIIRTPGRRHRAASVVYRGDGAAYRDRHVRNSVSYRYTLVATDQAGNVTTRSLVVRPGPRLLTPGRGARVSTPPLLGWTPVRGASYYNVQLYHGAKKVLSAWPRRASLQLKRTWSFDGHRRRLSPGRYRWYVWPGFGPRAAARYGSAVGSRTFVVTTLA
jgi:hypothetical protein